MKQPTRIALAGFLQALAVLLSSLATELVGATLPESTTTDPVQPATTDTTAAPAEEKEPRRAKAAPATATVEVPEVTTTAAATETETEEAPVDGKTIEDMRALFEPLVKDGKGAAVKKVILKYSTSGKLVDMDPKHYADFENDIAALSY